MSLRKPSVNDPAKIAAERGMEFDDAEIRAYRDLMASTIESYERLDRMADPGWTAPGP